MGIQLRKHGMGVARLAAVAGACLALANCASGKFASRFDPKYGVSSSPRVVDFGEAVPKGGGTYRVGKPYVVAGRVYVPQDNPHYTAVGLASWYGDDFHGRLTANGEVFDMTSLTAAHPTLPLPCYARVTNLGNGKSLIVRVNDRGPYHGNRIIDVSHRAASLLGFQGNGVARVKVDYVGKAPLEGSDDNMLVATLRTNEPAPAPSSVRIASAAPFVPQTQTLIRGVARPDVPLPPERPFEMSDNQPAAPEARSASYGRASQAYASAGANDVAASGGSGYRAAGYAPTNDDAGTSNPLSGSGLY